jgi:3',5'-cyclic AMP phosphodiesterase CpdA
MPRVLVVTDTHWPAEGSAGNWEAVVRWLDEHPVDLVVHAGDASVDGAHHDEQVADAAAVLARLDVPWAAVPGNHDVGDPFTGGDPPVDDERLAGWVGAFGGDRWLLRLGPWAVVGLDSQLIGSDLPAEERQWSWLAAAAGELPPGMDVVVVTHKPVFAPGGEWDSKPHRFLPVGSRARLERCLAGRPLRLVLTGHVHQWRQLTEGTTAHVWVPSAWAVLPEGIQRTIGEKRCGAVLADLGADGSVAVRLVEPAGLTRHVAGGTVANPYAR